MRDVTKTCYYKKTIRYDNDDSQALITYFSGGLQSDKFGKKHDKIAEQAKHKSEQ